MKGFEKELAALERQKPSLDEVVAALQAGLLRGKRFFHRQSSMV